ncbi:MAG: Na(+) H(+) antiporter subunit G [uncultured Thermomicrobiales bacterium]|uniref:Na(+) H(+) antiporter subunit G n=1 Tax=uncultured Thermomicrobiales bacterium TaxID=1645740 RepID=A0A6J4U6S9_9BACT|nr:MAG: Na(+) H(+) antiporter subunit G [uncultured Thermomicrobiales bacterium]
MPQSFLPWVADVLVIVGLLILSIAIYGMVRMPDLYTRLHAASKAAFLGILPLLFVAATTGGPASRFRAFLIAVCLLLTTPVAAHAIAQAAYRTREPLETPGAVDESGRRLPEREPGPT